MSNWPRDMVVMYGCPPPEPGDQTWPVPIIPTFTPTHDNCSKCNRHIRIGDVCPWCHADAVKEALKKPEPPKAELPMPVYVPALKKRRARKKRGSKP